MEQIKNISDLKLRIAYLEGEKKMQELALRQELKQMHEQLKPANLLKSAVGEIFSSRGGGSGLLDGALGMASGLLTKKLVAGSLGHPLRVLLGNLLQGFVKEKVAENAGGWREGIANALREFLNKKPEDKKENPTV